MNLTTKRAKSSNQSKARRDANHTGLFNAYKLILNLIRNTQYALRINQASSIVNIAWRILRGINNDSINCSILNRNIG